MARGIGIKRILAGTGGAHGYVDAPTANPGHSVTRVDPSLEHVAREAP